MWMAMLTLAGALGLSFAAAVRLRPTYIAAPLGWRILAHAGWPLSLAGAVFVLRFWNPTSGPFRANVRYPFGSHLSAWAVSFGFTWIALGLLFTALAILTPRGAAARDAWLALFAAWIVCWLPHGVIAAAFLLGGTDPQSVTDYRDWGSNPVGALILVADALLLLLHVGLSVAGFAMTGRAAWRVRGTGLV